MVTLLLAALAAEPPPLVRIPTGAAPVEGACPSGQVEVEGAGRCCWPGQRWDATGTSCLGDATCPPDTQPAPEGCYAHVDVVPPKPKVVHWTELKLKSKVNPTSPPRSAYQGAEQVRCSMRIHVDPTGTPTSVEPTDCAEPFAAAAQEAMLRWRYYPLAAGFEGSGGVDTAVTLVFTLPQGL